MSPPSLALAVSDPIPQRLPDWPTFGLEDDIRAALEQAMADGEPAALATLYATDGGAPRGVGAQMLITREVYSGFLSGGCVEGDVALHAIDTLADGRPQWLVYGEGGPFDIQLPCGSRIDILLERIMPNDPAARRLIAQSTRRQPALWVTDGAVRATVDPSRTALLPSSLRVVGHRGNVNSACGYTQPPFVAWRAYTPRRRLVVVGSDPTALALLRLGTEMGFETILVRPHGPDHAPASVSTYLRLDVPDAFAAVELDAWTGVAILTHDVEQEHAALMASLLSPAFYIGALGSQRRIPDRNARLRAAGVQDDRINFLRAPIGLPIGGKSPWAVCVSIMAEIMTQATAMSHLNGLEGALLAR